MITVTRRYSIKRILNDLEEWDRLKKVAELAALWQVDTTRLNRLINSIVDKGPQLTGQRLLQAAHVLDVDMEELMEPYEDITNRPVKI